MALDVDKIVPHRILAQLIVSDFLSESHMWVGLLSALNGGTDINTYWLGGRVGMSTNIIFSIKYFICLSF